MNYKYVILDFGNVIAAPKTGHWDITEKFQELIDTSKMDMDMFKTIRKKYGDILSRKIDNLDDEYQMFIDFYDGILSEFNFPNYCKNISEKIAYDRTYNLNKYIVYDNVYNELAKLKEKYTLILLTDNWPCVIDYLKENKLWDYFEKIYISSFYGVEKKDKVFFDYPITDFKLDPCEAVFIDDNEKNLDIAKEKGFGVLLMDREEAITNSKYKIINDLSSL